MLCYYSGMVVPIKNNMIIRNYTTKISKNKGWQISPAFLHL